MLTGSSFMESQIPESPCYWGYCLAPSMWPSLTNSQSKSSFVVLVLQHNCKHLASLHCSLIRLPHTARFADMLHCARTSGTITINWRVKYWAICSIVLTLARIAHSFAYYALICSLTHSSRALRSHAPLRSFIRSITLSFIAKLMGKRFSFFKLMHHFYTISTHFAGSSCGRTYQTKPTLCCAKVSSYLSLPVQPNRPTVGRTDGQTHL